MAVWSTPVWVVTGPPYSATADRSRAPPTAGPGGIAEPRPEISEILGFHVTLFDVADLSLAVTFAERHSDRLGKGDWSVPVGDSTNDSVVESAVEFRLFVESFDRQLWRSLVPAFGAEVANEATADALAYAWQHWARIRSMENPRGYLYRVARSYALPRRRPEPILPEVDSTRLPEYEPGLLPALAELTEMQRTVVYLVEGCQWGLTEVSELLGVSVSTVRNHLARGMDRLRAILEVRIDV